MNSAKKTDFKKDNNELKKYRKYPLQGLFMFNTFVRIRALSYKRHDKGCIIAFLVRGAVANIRFLQEPDHVHVCKMCVHVFGLQEKKWFVG